MTTTPPQPDYPSPQRRRLITGSVMMSTMIVTLDSTIANVALPHMQSSLMASSEQITWVLTSYLIASAIMTPLSSWLANRFGRKRVMILSAIGFTISSLACGLATNMTIMLVARLVQGISGAGLIPLGQATLLDINPPEKQGQAMAMAGMGSMVGPLIGPSLGGWLTDMISWRWVFLINIPVGILTVLAMSASMIEVRGSKVGRFDMFGFATLSIFLAAFQLMMDRGQQQDWFDSAEIMVEAGVMAVAAWLIGVHMFTRRDTFLRAAIFTDRNFALGSLISAVIGVVVFATVPIMAVMMQSSLGYTAFHAGVVNIPRSVGTILGLLVVTRAMGKVDARVLLTVGLVICAWSLHIMAGISLAVDEVPLMVSGFLHGFAGGIMIAPLSTLVYSTLPIAFRNEGAALYSLARSMGNSIGISVLQLLAIRNTAAVKSRLNEGIRPDNPVIQLGMPELRFDELPAMLRVAGETTRQAVMVATVDVFWLACILAVLSILIVPMMTGRRRGT